MVLTSPQHQVLCFLSNPQEMTVNLVSFCREVLLLYFLDYGQLRGRNSEIFELLMYITHDWTQLSGSYKSFIIQIV
jgi:hypothetical protein